METKMIKDKAKLLNIGYEDTGNGLKTKDLDIKFFEDNLDMRTKEDNPEYDNKRFGCLSIEAFKDGKRVARKKPKINNEDTINEINLFKMDNMDSNIYTTINTVSYDRADKNIQGLNAVYVDIDTTHNVNTDSMTHSEIMASKKAHEDRQYIQSTILNNGIDEILYNNFEKMNINNELLKPNYVEFTGHGFLLVYLFKNQVAVNDKRKASSPIVYKWKHLENYICKQVQKALDLTFNDKNTAGMVDTKATNVTRLMRVPATTNWKSKPVATKIIEYNADRYSFFELSRVLTPKPKRKRKSAKKSKKSKKNFEITKTNLKGLKTLNRNRIADMNTILSKFNGKDANGNLEGFRETAIYYYSIIAGAIMQGEKLLKELHHFNVKLNKCFDSNSLKQVNYIYEEWKNNPVMQLNNASFRALKEGEGVDSDDEKEDEDDENKKFKKEYKKDKKGNTLVKNYAPTNASILELFGITPEQEVKLGLRTIMSKTEKYRRRTNSRRTESATNGAKASKKARDNKIIDMYFNQDMSKSEIAKKINVSVSTIKRVVKKYM